MVFDVKKAITSPTVKKPLRGAGFPDFWEDEAGITDWAAENPPCVQMFLTEPAQKTVFSASMMGEWMLSQH